MSVLFIKLAEATLPRSSVIISLEKSFLPNTKTHGLLCATTLKLNLIDQDILIGSIIVATQNFCLGWAIIVYEGRGRNDTDIYNEIIERLSREEGFHNHKNVSITVISVPPKKASQQIYRDFNTQQHSSSRDRL